MEGVQALTHARVPIVKLVEPETKIACDICVNNLLPLANTKLLRDYASIDPRCETPQSTFSQHSVIIQSTFNQRSVFIQSTCVDHSVNVQCTFNDQSVNVQ